MKTVKVKHPDSENYFLIVNEEDADLYGGPIEENVPADKASVVSVEENVPADKASVVSVEENVPLAKGRTPQRKAGE